MNSKAQLEPPPIERMHKKTMTLLAEQRRIPASTYRLQFHAGFTFRDAARLAPYLRALGISHCYASPYLKARPGSTHGYDIVDHASLNPEIGSDEDFDAWVKALADNNLGQIVDVVPNHMAVATNDNAWWNDVLENGPASRFAGHFDIAWRASSRPQLQDKVLLPVLGEPYGEALETGLLPLAFDKGAFIVRYHERRFPLDPGGFGIILGRRLDELEKILGPESPAFLEYQSILTGARNLPDRSETDAAKVGERLREKEIIKRRLAALANDNQPVRDFIEQNLVEFNGQPGNPRSFDLLHDLLEHQCFRLAYWRVALDEINYRRFFDINDLAAVSIEREEVFAAVHALILRLAAEGKIDGLRIDHPDGLYDPAQYFRRLQEHFAAARARWITANKPANGDAAEPDAAPAETPRPSAAPAQNGAARRPLYVVAEKILAAGEPLPEHWAVDGTTGYDFLNDVNDLFVDGANKDAFNRIYEDFVGDDAPFAEMVYRKKLLVLQASMASELHMLTRQLDQLAQKSWSSRDFTFNTLRLALRAVVACFPVYRSYIAGDELDDHDRRNIQLAVRRATIRNPLISRRVFQFLRGMLMLETPPGFSSADKAEQRRFAGKFQQVTAPVSAKGVEDTAFYLYNRLISLNEVGGDPARFGVAPEALHAVFRERQAKWPLSFSSLSTHDTKRSEDVRARLNVLSEMPEEWRQCLVRWSGMNRPHRQRVDDVDVPDANEEILLYQTLVGAWPLGEVAADERASFVTRIGAFMEKALHEAKEHTSWINPNAEYDRAVTQFITQVLDENSNRAFLDDLRRFVEVVGRYGMLNSLSQTLLKFTAPGVPDTYQGTELWDFSLVDPDNRRPVDYARRREMLAGLHAGSANPERVKNLVRDLLATREDGRIKMYVTSRALHCRRDYPELFANGSYLPLTTSGDKAAHVFAFARNAGKQWTLVAVPRLVAQLIPDSSKLPLGPATWDKTTLHLDGMSVGLRWRNVFTGATLAARDSFAAAEVFAGFPVAMLMADE